MSVLRFAWAGVPGTCLWCGRKLRRWTGHGSEDVHAGVGRRGNGYFDTLACAERFAIRAAASGVVLVTKGHPKP